MEADRLGQLISRARAGEWEAFGELVRHYQLPLRVYAARLGLRGDDLDEVTQEAFVRALESLGRYDPSLPFLAWLAGITRHVYQQQLERGARESKARSGPLAAYLGARRSEGPTEISSQRLAVLRGCMEKLTATARSMVELRFRDDLDLKRIAERIGTESVGSVSKALFRIRRQLAECVRLSWKPCDHGSGTLGRPPREGPEQQPGSPAGAGTPPGPPAGSRPGVAADSPPRAGRAPFRGPEPGPERGVVRGAGARAGPGPGRRALREGGPGPGQARQAETPGAGAAHRLLEGRAHRRRAPRRRGGPRHRPFVSGRPDPPGQLGPPQDAGPGGGGSAGRTGRAGGGGPGGGEAPGDGSAPPGRSSRSARRSRSRRPSRRRIRESRRSAKRRSRRFGARRTASRRR